MINSTVGLAGLFDPAGSEEVNLLRQDEDFGQTLGIYGAGQGFYLVWPFLGPWGRRDTVGMVGDFFAYPLSYLDPWYAWLAVRGYQMVNDTSLSIGDYEAIKEAAIDPYLAIRNAYAQYRQKKVEERTRQSGSPARTFPAQAPRRAGSDPESLFRSYLVYLVYLVLSVSSNPPMKTQNTDLPLPSGGED